MKKNNNPGGDAEIIELVKSNGLKSTINRIFRYITFKAPINTLPVEHLSVRTLYRIFELRGCLLPRVSDKNPLDLVWLNPNEVEYLHPPGLPRPPDRYGYVIGGCWDQNKVLFDDYFAHQSLVNRYENGLDWEQTEMFKWRLSNIENGTSPRGLSSKKELQAYLDGIDELYESISNRGYKSQRELMESNPNQSIQTNNDSIHPALHEICVNIGRNGEIIKRGSGQHRLSIAKILDLDEIPVIVKTRHKEWQQIRHQMRSKSILGHMSPRAGENFDHPDLSDIAPRNR